MLHFLDSADFFALTLGKGMSSMSSKRNKWYYFITFLIVVILVANDPSVVSRFANWCFNFVGIDVHMQTKDTKRVSKKEEKKQELSETSTSVVVEKTTIADDYPPEYTIYDMKDYGHSE